MTNVGIKFLLKNLKNSDERRVEARPGPGLPVEKGRFCRIERLIHTNEKNQQNFSFD